ncbi:MAG: C45 family autoproteolytic acyltransferase/hydrolase [Planctomycetaceae bacterium]|jgi:isopenicillin-N N-acyltransferase-like protein
MATEYPLIEAAGDPWTLGVQHGEQAARFIRGYLDSLAESLRLTRQALRDRARRFEPLFDQHCPELLVESRGLERGAGLLPVDGLVVQLRGELAQLPDGGCTTFAIGPAGTASGTTLVGQTSDNPPELEEFGYVLKLRPTGKPAVLMWTFGGMLGYHGLNEHGVSQFANALGGGPGWRFALSHYPLKRLMLEQTSLAGVRDLVRRLPVCSNGNYMLADGSGAILDLELTSEGVHELPVEGPCLVHSNHFLCAAHACQENWKHSPLDSAPRLVRMKSLLESRLGSLDVAQVGECLADHDGYPVSLCRHPSDGPAGPMLDQRGKTVAALIAEPQSRRLHVARGNPCVNRFVTYQLD